MIATLLVLVTTFGVSVPSQAWAAKKKPTVTWKATTLPADSSIKPDSLATTVSTGKKHWSVTGSCTISKGTIRTSSNGTCTVRLFVDAKGQYASASASRRMTITEVVSIATYDPYAGTKAGIPAVGSAVESRLVTADGRTRRYRTYVPASLPAGKVPLLVALHGGLGTSSQFEANSGFDELAESNGFIVVYPDGVGNQPDGTGYQAWNGGYCCGVPQTQNIDDVGFIRDLIDSLSVRYAVDPAKVFVAGHSNGGILAYRLACELAGRIAAIGLQAGSNIFDGCAPTLPVSVLHIHGTADTNLPINGGRGTGVSATVWVSALSAVQAMAAVDGCSSQSTASKSATDPNVTASTWTKSGTNIQVRFVTVSSAAHAWMGHVSQTPGSASLVGVPYMNFDSSRAIWSFLVQHPRTP